MNVQKLWPSLVIATLFSIVGFGFAAWRLTIADYNQIDIAQWVDTELDWVKDQSRPSQNMQFFEAPHSLNSTGFSVEVFAQLNADSDPSAAWGIWFKNQSGVWLIVAINGAGYVTARECPTQDMPRLDLCAPLTEPTQQILTYWKVFRFIRPRGEMNTVRVDYQADDLQVTLRLNHEWMWDIPYQPTTNTIQWGLWVQAKSNLQWSKIQGWKTK